MLQGDIRETFQEISQGSSISVKPTSTGLRSVNARSRIQNFKHIIVTVRRGRDIE